MKISLLGTKLQQVVYEEGSREGLLAKRYAGLALMLSPVAKAYASDEAWNIATLAIQVHGAIGYMRDLPLEQYVRDIKVLTIWEGTNYIQSQDLVRDKLGFGRQSLVLQHFEEDVRAFLAGADAHPDLAREYERVELALRAVLETMAWVRRQADDGELLKISQFCTRILQMFGDLLAAWGLLEAAAVADRLSREPAIDDAKRDFCRGKIKTMRFFVYNLLPRLFNNRDIIADSDNALVEMHSAEFAYAGGAGFSTERDRTSRCGAP